MAIKTVFITTTGTGTYTIPADFVSLVSIEAIGAGGTGNLGYNGAGSWAGQGGGGGAYAKSTTASGLTANSTTYYRVGTGGGTLGVNGTARTWFNTASNAEPSSASTGVLADGGTSGIQAVSNTAPGGNSTSCVGTVAYSGGTGSPGISSARQGGSGGGAAGPGGAGGPAGAGLTAGAYGPAGGGGDIQIGRSA